jgi:hypothetical protein
MRSLTLTLTLLLILILTCALTFALPPSTPVLGAAERAEFADRSRDMVLRGMNPFAVTAQGNRIEVQGRGTPFEGTWRSDGLSISGRSFEGIVEQSGRRLKLQSAMIAGGVTAVQEKGGRKVSLEAGRLRLAMAASPTLDATGQVRIRTAGGPAGESLDLQALTGQARLDPSGGLLGATLQGGTTLELRSDGGKRMYAQADRAELDYAARPARLVLTGRVRIDGDHPAFAGKVDGVSKATVRLDAQGRPTQVDLEGGGGMQFHDRAETMSLRNLHPFSLVFAQSGAEVRFRGRGNPFTGVWTPEGLTLTGQGVDGMAARTSGGHRLRQATLTGGATVRQTKAGRVVTARGQRVRFQAGSESRIDVEGRASLESRGPGAGEGIKMLGERGTVTLATGGGVRRAVLEGGAKIDLSSGGRRLEASARRAEYDNASQPAKIVLSGDVSLDGNHRALSGKVRGVARAVVTLDASGQPERIEYEGASGTATLSG